MTNSVPDLRPAANHQTPRIKRRGLLGALGALAAGVVARLTEAPLSAGTDGDVVLGGPNTTATTTSISTTTASTTAVALSSNSGATLSALNSSRVTPSAGIQASGVYGVAAITNVNSVDGIGVLAHGLGNGGASAVVAHSDSGHGVRSFSEKGVGVMGESKDGYPLIGRVRRDNSVWSIAIYGLNDSLISQGPPGGGGFGIYGVSMCGHGVVGVTTAAGAAGIVGATNGVAGTAAGAFFGDVFVRGSLTVAGGAKSAAVPHPDGTHRRLYCMESPESWFEDFGQAQLACGRAEVAFDPDFAALVNLSAYHVYLTEHGTHHHVTLKQRTPTGFTVEADAELAALKGRALADLNGTFSWRVVAKRKDIDGERLATVVIPSAPTLPEPPPPAPPMPETPRQHVR